MAGRGATTRIAAIESNRSQLCFFIGIGFFLSVTGSRRVSGKPDLYFRGVVLGTVQMRSTNPVVPQGEHRLPWVIPGAHRFAVVILALKDGAGGLVWSGDGLDQ